MTSVEDSFPRNGFGRAFGEQLESFLREKLIPASEAARRLEVTEQRLNHYLRDKETGDERASTVRRPEPLLGFAYLVCTKLGFVFEYEGYRTKAEKSDGSPIRSAEPQQLEFRFNQKFKLPEDQGAVRVNVHRPPGRIELSVSLKANAS